MIILARDHQQKNCYIINVLSIILYIIILSSFSIAKHRNFRSFAWDLGIYNQAVWTTAMGGSIFQYNCESFLVESGSFFGVHFSPILYILVPFYRIFPWPETLLVVQTIILGLSALPLYLITRDLINDYTALFVSFLYLVNPVVHGINCYDFHVQCFLPFLAFSSIYYLNRNEWKPYFVSSLLSLMVEEHFLYTMTFFIFAFLTRSFIASHRRDNIFTKESSYQVALLAAIFYWAMLSSSIIRFFNPIKSPILVAGRHYNVLGVNDPAKIPGYILAKPQAALDALKFNLFDKFMYLLQIFGPVSFLSFLSPVILVSTLPWFAISLLSNYLPYYSIGYQYPAYVVPFIYISFIKGLNVLKTRYKRNFTVTELRTTALVVNIVLFGFLSPISPFVLNFGGIPSYYVENNRDHSFLLETFVKRIPRGSTVLTQDNIFPHLSSSDTSYVVPPPAICDESTWNLALTELLDIEPDYILFDESTYDHQGFMKIIREVSVRPYEVLSSSNGCTLFKRSGLKASYPDTGLVKGLLLPMNRSGGVTGEG